MGKFIDLTGKVFGRLTVIELAGRDKNKLILWFCKCECGNEITTRGQDLRRGKSFSCGCFKNDQLINRSTSHGMAGSRPYRIWKNMKSRCYNPNVKSFADYGARGIKICDRWKDSFKNFWEDTRPTYADSLEIDRIDHDGDYCPENCRWANKTLQNRNTRANHIVDSKLGQLTIAELAEKSGIDYNVLKRRIHRGWSPDRLLDPVKEQKVGS